MFPILLTAIAQSSCSSARPAEMLPLQCSSELHGRYPVKISWLRNQTTVAEAERAHISEGVAFGPVLNPEWTRLLGLMKPGDQLWEFSGCPLPPPAVPPSHNALFTCGDVGYALVRGCEVVAHIVYQMS